eukprot:TRINITY_DN70328_c0_g1_i1.p1 TRINITY_DN70328_c0_g1~~TRINITY_DN70328_c0_g1_i1.p1  ORF type:complete len:302 (+),score=76.12 TRINITY_DN70328_c0_g1_i1:84-908(+)
MAGEVGRRSKFAGSPGSITAIRVDYGRSSVAFEPLEPTSKVAIQKEEACKWKAAQRLGEKPEWNSSIVCRWQKFPDRASMRTLQEFQSTRLEFNYRAQTLPTCYKNTLFMPKTDKFQFDGSMLLGESDKAKLVRQNPGGGLSRSEFPDEAPCIHDNKWNNSTELDHERGSRWHKKDYFDYRPLNAARGAFSPQRYRNPMQQTSIGNRQLRALKEREQAQRRLQSEAETQAPRVYKMSNKHEWQHAGFLPDLASGPFASADASGVRSQAASNEEE